ncbi:hypothetical protein [Pseudomonas sp. PB101]|uniref:hypothetical protein n=1 Tax=Pseudomonas sp. PB101 TaxID=2495428 RepID=UPI0021146379|nr:hypothetical protein [Pseudomonas sp. PB101]
MFPINSVCDSPSHREFFLPKLDCFGDTLSARHFDEPTDKEIIMTQHRINALLHFPPDYEVPEGCDINVKVQNITDRTVPILHGIWGSNTLPSARPINFDISVDSNLNAVGSRYVINVKISHQNTALLLDIDREFHWAGGDHDADIYLSPVGYIAVEKTWMPRIGYPADSKLYVKLIEPVSDENDEALVCEGVGLTGEPNFYLKYDPSMIKPGRLYTLVGSFETYGPRQLSLGLHPAKLILKPNDVVNLPGFSAST